MGRKLYLGSQAVTPATTIEKVVPETRFGKTVANFLGTVNEQGIYLSPQVGDIVFTGLQYLSGFTYPAMSMVSHGVTSISFPDLKTISGSNAFLEVFKSNPSLLKVSFPSLESVCGTGVATNCFNTCSYNTSVFLPMLTVVRGSQALDGAFRYNSRITRINLSSFTTSIEERNLQYCFIEASISYIAFPSLRTVTERMFGGTATGYAFYTCTNLTEIHFRRDMADVIPTVYGYSTKWGATNATIYFDLVGYITVNGITYARSEQDSIYSDETKQYVAWVDANITDDNDNVYTRDASKDTNEGYGTLGRVLWAWTLGSATIYTRERHPTTASKVYNANGVEQTTTLVNVYSDLVYTAYDETTKAEPDVGTTVYSDAGQTVLGTITAIA